MAMHNGLDVLAIAVLAAAGGDSTQPASTQPASLAVPAAAGGESTQPARLAPLKLHPRLPPVLRVERTPHEHTRGGTREKAKTRSKSSKIRKRQVGGNRSEARNVSSRLGRRHDLFRVSSNPAPRTHDLFNLQFPPVCHGRFMAVKDDLWGAGLGFTAIMLSRLMYVAAQDRRILIEVPAKKPRWCNTPPQTLQCFYQPWTNCSLDQQGADIIHVSLKSYHSSRKWYGKGKTVHTMYPTPNRLFFRPNALVQRHVNAVIAQCGGTDYWTVHVRDSPEKRRELHTTHLLALQGYVRRLPQNVTRILWQTANPAAFQAILRYSSQRPGLRFCYTNFSRHTEDVWGGRNASFTDESGLTGAVNGELGHLGTGLISLRSSMWTAFLASLNASMKVIAV